MRRLGEIEVDAVAHHVFLVLFREFSGCMILGNRCRELVNAKDKAVDLRSIESV